MEDFPGGAVVKNPPANAGDTGSIPVLGRSHMLRSSWAWVPQLPMLGEQLSLSATTTNAGGPRACAPQLLKPEGSQAPVPQLLSMLQLLKPARSNEDPT